MTETRTMTLGDRTFAVPPLPIRVNITVYPLLRKLSNAGFVEDWFSPNAAPSEEDLVTLSDVLFHCARAAEPELTREAFDAIVAPPSQLMDGLLIARFQSGGWVPAKDGETGEAKDEGEGEGAPKPPK